MRTITVAERRARLARRHRLSTPAGSIDEAVRAVGVLHATDPATVYLSVFARCPGVTVEAVDQALYADRTLLRLHGMRRTLFVAPLDLVPAIQRSCGVAVAAQSRKTYLKLLADAGAGDAAWLADLERATETALAARGEATAAQLSVDEPRLRTQVTIAPGKPYESTQTITAWVLFLLAVEGRVARGRPAGGTWTNTQWTWSPMEKWLPGGVPEIEEEEARAELARRWLAAFGPAPASDLKWWAGWTLTQARKALAAIGAVEVDLDGQPGFVLAEDADPVPEPEPWVALLPALDPTPMGWSARDWYLGEHSGMVFDRTGNVGATVWSDGRIVGGWAQRSDGEIVFRLLEDLGADKIAEIEQAGGRLQGWLGDLRIAARGRRHSDIERALLA
ncbi:MAG: winged helix DNA-binding domain-containing protein [Hamadaea sp.]|uniref:winged helix DNA-binding domain-containing protein n=1 Tax=Hamadaea sp. TaxID=2024425 RepID=UPI0018531E8F|nr:winged helix DNA-binding domain-containing protein [Hamadaea sp.]NUT19620.1 winged helix DNA-binding domain-containing protein [Hamadaea sp.]